MILDTSAIVAILFDEPEADSFDSAIHAAENCRLSIANYLEVSMVLQRSFAGVASSLTETYLHQARIVLEPVTIEQGYLARQAFVEYGKGRHAAALNFGDCFAYALAKSTGEPLLFKGNDFTRTDIAAAI